MSASGRKQTLGTRYHDVRFVDGAIDRAEILLMEREKLNALKSQRVDGDPANEADHFYVCKQCGQAVDMRRLGDVFYHEEPGHEPLPANS